MTALGKNPGPLTHRLAVLLLAAGEGSRLGSIPKALLQKNGKSLLSHFCCSLEVFSPIEFLVVTGFHEQAIEAEIKQLQQNYDLPIQSVLNPYPELGQASSVRIGLENLKSDYEVLLVALCDQPFVGSKEIDGLLRQFEQRDQCKEVILPMVGQQRGNPVVFSRKVINDILALPAMVCRPFMDQHPELVQIFATDNQAYVADVDTDADISKFDLQRD